MDKINENVWFTQNDTYPWSEAFIFSALDALDIRDVLYLMEFLFSTSSRQKPPFKTSTSSSPVATLTPISLGTLLHCTRNPIKSVVNQVCTSRWWLALRMMMTMTTICRRRFLRFLHTLKSQFGTQFLAFITSHNSRHFSSIPLANTSRFCNLHTKTVTLIHTVSRSDIVDNTSGRSEGVNWNGGIMDTCLQVIDNINNTNKVWEPIEANQTTGEGRTSCAYW